MQSAAPFIVLRFVFGMLMAGGTLRFLWLGWVDDHYIRPLFHFRYFGFEWLPVLSGPWLYFLHLLLVLAALCFAFGYFYRISAWVLFLIFTYTELIDLSYYLNHYYFVSLACFLFCLAPEPSGTSAQFPGQMPRWATGMFKLLLGLVYFYAGMAKINQAWLFEALPLRIWLPARDTLPVIGPLMALPITPWVFSWGGMLYDCTIPFFLVWSRTRSLAYLSVVVFHTLTGILFQIGVFPVVMMGSALVFFSPDWHLRFLNLLRPVTRLFAPPAEPAVSRFLPRHSALAILGSFFVFQIFFPWRSLLYPGSMVWTEQGYRFGWRVMLMEKAGTARFSIRDPRTGRTGYVQNADFLNPHQEKQMAMQPDMILQFAHFLGRHFAERGISGAEVRAEVYVTLNGAPSRLLIDDTLNLMRIRDGWSHKNWIRLYPDNER
jgi:hypothetical protein